MKTITPARKRALWIAGAVLLVVVLLFLCLRFWTNGGKAVDKTPRMEVTLAFLPSADADANALTLMKAAAVQLFEDVQTAYQKPVVTALYWRQGVPPEGPSCAVTAVGGSDALSQALEQALPGGNLTTALQYARTLSEESDSLNRKVILLTDRTPVDGEASEEGPYDEEDAASYRYANAAYQAAGELSIRDALSTVAFPDGLSGAALDFTRRFLTDIQTDGYYEIMNAGGLDALRRDITSSTLTDSGVKKISFRYQSHEDYSAVCYYTDDYFSASSYDYNPSLATMSISFAMSAFASGDESRYANKSLNARQLLQDIGFPKSNIDVNPWFTTRPETDSIGVIAGNKRVTFDGETFTLVAVAMRGSGYGREWASNFTIGETGRHSGFETAKNNVLDFLKTYLTQQKVKGPVKFWVTGFSRAAATANLLAGALDDGYDFGANVAYRPEDVYAYCFETPAGALLNDVRNRDVYYNIFNVINQSDPVPYVAPSPLGFGRYGIDRYLPSPQSSADYLSERAAMLRVYSALDSTDTYVVDNFRMKKLNLLLMLLTEEHTAIQDDDKNNYSQGVYLSTYATMLANDFIKDRKNYAEHYEQEIREVCSILFGCSDAQQKVIMDSLKRQAAESWPAVLIAYFHPLISTEQAFSIVADWLVTAVNEANVTDYDEETLRSAGVALSDLLVNLLSKYPNYAATLVANLENIGAAHFPELCFAWLASMDENYKRGAEVAFNNGNYRIVRVNCEVDVSVTDANGDVVARIVDEKPQDIRGSSIISAVNENGEKIVILPVDSAYEISVTRREAEKAQPQEGDGDATGETPLENVNVGIDEYSSQTETLTRGVDYLDVALPEGETMKAVIPAHDADELASGVPEGSGADYALIMPDGSEVQSVSDLSGEASENAVYTVTALSSDEQGGIVSGGGALRYGDFVQLEAVAQRGYDFLTWYETNEADAVSTESVYRFCVTADRTLTARFEPLRFLFGDVSAQNYCYDAILWAVKAGIASGTTETTFSPWDVCTAAQAVTFLWRAAGSPDPASMQSPFTDIDPDAYYYKAALWAAEQDITLGTTQTSFTPDRPLSRSQFVALLYRMYGKGFKAADVPFSDVAYSAYYYDAVGWAYGEGVTKGVKPDAFEPSRSCDRGQIVTFLYRYFVG